MAERVWTENEKKWTAMLTNDPEYEILPMKELYPTLPEPDAYDENREKFGHPDCAIWCQLFMAHLMFEMITNTVVLVHGTMNCNSCIRNFHGQLWENWGNPFPHMPTTAVDKRQVVFGGEEELYQAIRRIDADYKPKLIAIFPGCAMSLVQDDFERVIKKAQPEVGSKLFYWPVAGYEERVLGIMIEKVTVMWAELMDSPTKKIPDAVNILGANREVHWPHVRGCHGERPYDYPSETEELGRYIEALGLKVHRVMLASGGDYDYVRTAPEAAINTIACGTWGFPLADRMQEKFGIPYIRHELPLGVEASTRWIMDLAKAMGRVDEAEKLIKSEYARIEKVWEECKEMVAGKTLICSGMGNRASSYLRFCHELGMDTIYIPAYPDMGMCVDEGIKGKRVDWEYFMDYGYDPLVLRLREGQLRDYRKYYLPALMSKLGLSEDDMVYMYCDFSAYSGQIDPGRIAYVNTSVHLRRRKGYPSRAVGFQGVEGMCLDVMDAIRASKRKGSPTLYSRIYAK